MDVSVQYQGNIGFYSSLSTRRVCPRAPRQQIATRPGRGTPQVSKLPCLQYMIQMSPEGKRVSMARLATSVHKREFFCKPIYKNK